MYIHTLTHTHTHSHTQARAKEFSAEGNHTAAELVLHKVAKYSQLLSDQRGRGEGVGSYRYL